MWKYKLEPDTAIEPNIPVGNGFCGFNVSVLSIVVAPLIPNERLPLAKLPVNNGYPRCPMYNLLLSFVLDCGPASVPITILLLELPDKYIFIWKFEQ